MLNRIKNYLRGVRTEFTKITWPSWEEALSLTVLVLVMVLVLTVYVGALDAIFGQLLKYLIR